MKILLVVHCFFPDHFYGTETYTLELARGLRRRGFEVEILSTLLQGEKGQFETSPFDERCFCYRYDDLTVHCVDYNHFPHGSFQDTYYRPAMRPFYRDLLTRLAPELIHVTHLMNHTAVFLEAARECGIPTLATLTDFFPLCLNAHLSAPDGGLCVGPGRFGGKCLECYVKIYGDGALSDGGRGWARRGITRRVAVAGAVAAARLPGFKRRAFSRRIREVTERAAIVRRAYRLHRYMVTPTDFLHRAFIANGYPAERMVKINFGINWEVVADWRRVRTAPVGRPLRFGYIGQLVEHKGVDLLVEAFRELPGGSELVLYGSADPAAPFTKRLEKLAAGAAGVRFAGTFPEKELGRRLATIDVLVIPSRWYENCPLVMLYALATHTPVIVSAVPGMTEFVKDHRNGLAFARGSRVALGRALREFIERPGLVEEFSRQADYRKTISDHVGEIVALYQKISGRR